MTDATAVATAPKGPGGADSATQWTSVAFVLMLVLIIAGPLMTGGDDFSGGGNPARQAGYLLALGMMVAATLRQDGLVRALQTSLPCNLLLVYCWMSLLWAIEPGVGMRRLVLTTIIIYSVFITVGTLGVAATLRLMRRMLVALLLLNVACVAVAPGIGITQFIPGGDPSVVGDWRGLLGEKNNAGAVTAMTLLILVFDPRPRVRGTGWLMALAFAFLVMTGSKTALGICVVALIAGLGLRRYDWRFWPFALTGLALGAIGFALLVAASWDRITAVLHQQDAFTGRPQIWSALLSYVRDHWLLGAGYGSFWNIGADSPIYAYAKQGSWLTQIASAHDGYLDITAQIGVPGLILAVFALFVHPLCRLVSDPRQSDYRPLLGAMLLFCAGQNLTESTMLDRDYFVQVCLMWSIAAQSAIGGGRRSDRAGFRQAQAHGGAG